MNCPSLKLQPRIESSEPLSNARSSPVIRRHLLAVRDVSGGGVPDLPTYGAALVTG
jgi:hypothetical protein